MPAGTGGNVPAGSTALSSPTTSDRRSLRRPLLWGVAVGVVQAAAPLAFPWLPPATVYALSLPVIAAVYIGFAVGDGRRHVLAVETAVASAFVVVAAAAVTGSAWLISRAALTRASARAVVGPFPAQTANSEGGGTDGQACRVGRGR